MIKMKTPVKLLISAGAAAMVAAGCSSARKAPAEAAPEFVMAPERMPIGGQTAPIPRAVVYRTNGDYRNNVTVQVNAAGDIVSYPAPGDVRGMEPVELADGWLLSRRGVNKQTAFTRYTYQEYQALESAPSPSALRSAIIAGAKVTAISELPMTTSEALADTAAVNRILLP